MKKLFKRFVISVLVLIMTVISAIPVAAEKASDANQALKSTTIYFDDLELTLDEESASICNYNIMPRGNRWYTSIPSQYWGAYSSSDGKYYLQINSGTDIDFYGENNYGALIFCDGSKVTALNLYPAASNSDNFNITYSSYKIISSGVVKNEKMYISGKYSVSDKSFEIHSITYYYQ